MEKLEKLSGKSEYPPISSFLNLLPVTEEEVSEMQAWVSMNKGDTHKLGGITRQFHTCFLSLSKHA